MDFRGAAKGPGARLRPIKGREGLGLGGSNVWMWKGYNSKNLTGKPLGDPYTLPSSTDGETETQRK